ncbi:MAG: radical SAM protein [Candidatus Thermoplasmatota archaeon]|nr:radical SAM protein [Candidatus Thermoplasmatota archaeon]
MAFPYGGGISTAKVALIQPGKDQRFAITEPLSLGFIASYLEKRCIEVRIIDELAGQDIKASLSAYNPDIVGVTATTPVVLDAYRIAGLCREMGIPTVMGGVHASVLPHEALQYVDIVVVGEGEKAMLDIVKDGKKSGIVSGQYIKNLDEIPPPARHLMDMDFYVRTKDRLQGTFLYFVPPHTKTASILTSRGCPHACIFCHNTWRGIPYRFNSAERVISEIKELIEIYGIEALFFVEDDFFVNKPRLRKICNMMKQNKFDLIWGANARVDSISLESLQLVKKAGCRQVTFGFESGSQRILDILNKGTTVEQNRKAIKLCKKVGLLINGTFIIGNPTETIEDIKATQRFIKDNKIDSVGLCIATPYPGTKLWQWCEERGLIPKSFNWSDFLFDKISIPACDTIPPEEIEKLYQETCEIASKTGSILFSWLKETIKRNPTRAMIRAIKHPMKLLNILRKVKIGY